MANVSDFYNRLVTTQVCVRKPAAACPFSWRSSHSLASCPLLWISAQVQLPVRSRGNCWSVFQQSELGSTPHKRTVLPLVVHGFSPHTPHYYEIFSTVEKEPLQCPEFLRLLLSGSSEFCLKMARTRGVIYTHRQQTHFQKNLFSNQRTWRTSVSWKVGVDGKAQYVWFSCLLIVQWW